MKNPRDIEEVVKGSEYYIPTYRVTNEGIVDCESTIINFCRGNKLDENNPKRQQGVFVESLLEVCLQRLKAVNVGDLATRETSVAITKVEETIMWLEKRSNDRKIRGVEGTYNK